MVLAYVVGAGAASTPLRAQDSGPASDRYFFAQTEDWKHCAPISAAVVRQILRTPLAKEGASLLTEDQKRNIERFFCAKAVQLAPNEHDLIVAGDGFMSGADSTWFWVVRWADGKPKVVLAEGTDLFDLRQSRTNGLLDIGTEWASPNESVHRTFRFDGRSYRKCDEKWVEKQ